MLNVKVEQRVTIKFLTKAGKSATETYKLLTEVYGDQCLSRTQIFKWFKKFKEGREEVGDDPKPGRPSTTKTVENVEKVAKIVRGDHRLSLRAVAELTNINKETVRQILHNELGMKKGDLDLSDSGAPSVDGNEASDGAGPAEANDEGSSFSRDDFETCDLSDVKVKVEHTDDFCLEPETKRQRVGDYQEESKMEEALTILRDLKQSYSASQGPNDRFTLYGQHVAGKLRSYGEKTSAIVEHAINNILFEADMGNYDGIHTALPSHDDSAQ